MATSNNIDMTLYLPAEWHEQSGVQLTWPHAKTDWAPILPDITKVFVELTRAIAKYEIIDEIHLIVGAGKTDGAMDAGNLLKPMLARGELHCIGATTLDEYRENIEKDKALERRFQRVLVQEPTVEDTISILRGLKERFEIHHGVNIHDNALVAAAISVDRKSVV